MTNYLLGKLVWTNYDWDYMLLERITVDNLWLRLCVIRKNSGQFVTDYLLLENIPLDNL